MGRDIMIGPSGSNFKDWTSEEWDSYFESCKKIDSEKLGSWTSVQETLETINVNLENDQPGSVYPTIQKTLTEEHFIGWYNNELPALIEEIRNLKTEFKNLPLHRQIILEYDRKGKFIAWHYSEGKYLEEIVKSFKTYYPNKLLENLYDFNHHFFDTIEQFALKALKENKGLLLE